LPGTTPDATYCPIEHVPFRGVNCSDAAGQQIAYDKIPITIKQNHQRGESGSPYGNDQVVPDTKHGTTVVQQYWYDDTVSLRRKNIWAREQGLAGVGPFAFHYLAGYENYTDTEVVAMWSAFDAFFRFGRCCGHGCDSAEPMTNIYP